MNFQNFLEARHVGLECANMPKIWQQAAILVMEPFRGALPIVRVDLRGESAERIERLVHAVIIEDLTRLFSNDRVFLDPCIKEAIDPLEA